MQKLERINHNPQQAWMEALKEYKDVPAEEWPMPAGFRTRLAPEFFSRVYSAPRSAVEYGQKWAEEHGCSHCSWIKGYIDALACVDRLLLGDKPPNLVNSISLEYLARKAHAIEVGFGQCRVESDWRKPKNAQKDWSTKVDFEMIKRIDPGISQDLFGGTEYMRDAKEELRGEMTRDADLAKVRGKLAERTDILDPLNA